MWPCAHPVPSLPLLSRTGGQNEVGQGKDREINHLAGLSHTSPSLPGSVLLSHKYAFPEVPLALLIAFCCALRWGHCHLVGTGWKHLEPVVSSTVPSRCLFADAPAEPRHQRPIQLLTYRVLYKILKSMTAVLPHDWSHCFWRKEERRTYHPGKKKRRSVFQKHGKSNLLVLYAEFLIVSVYQPAMKIIQLYIYICVCFYFWYSQPASPPSQDGSFHHASSCDCSLWKKQPYLHFPTAPQSVLSSRCFPLHMTSLFEPVLCQPC